MATRGYGQHCGLARALELVGERWALLVVRDLLGGPKRFTDLRRGLPRIPSNVLSARLKELESEGIIGRRLQAAPHRGVVYELTPYGRELEDVVLRLGRWGAESLPDPGPDDIVTPDSLVLALRATFRAEAAGELRASYQLRVGEVVVHARVDHGALEVAEGPVADPDLVLEIDLGLRRLLRGELSPNQAIQRGSLRITGNRGLLERFVEIFHIPPLPLTHPA
jgi:DNA-binding HxlR family transcriptional regulator/putative sterol carrier protein